MICIYQKESEITEYENGYFDDPRGLLCEYLKGEIKNLGTTMINAETKLKMERLLKFIEIVSSEDIFIPHEKIVPEKSFIYMLINLCGYLKEEVIPFMEKEIMGQSSSKKLSSISNFCKNLAFSCYNLCYAFTSVDEIENNFAEENYFTKGESSYNNLQKVLFHCLNKNENPLFEMLVNINFNSTDKNIVKLFSDENCYFKGSNGSNSSAKKKILESLEKDVNEGKSNYIPQIFLQLNSMYPTNKFEIVNHLFTLCSMAQEIVRLGYLTRMASNVAKNSGDLNFYASDNFYQLLHRLTLINKSVFNYINDILIPFLKDCKKTILLKRILKKNTNFFKNYAICSSLNKNIIEIILSSQQIVGEMIEIATTTNFKKKSDEDYQLFMECFKMIEDI